MSIISEIKQIIYVHTLFQVVARSYYIEVNKIQ